MSMHELDRNKLPNHIAIIMDGNGRWAKKRLLNRVSGHQKGANAVREVVRASRELGIKVLTLYAFSVENWGRPAVEVKALMSLLRKYITNELDNLLTNDIRLTSIGDLESLPKEVYTALTDSMKKTESCKGMLLNLALSYGGRDDILNAVRKILNDYDLKRIRPENIKEEVFSNYLFTAGIPDPDLLIRTSGEYRISNFLLWQIAYTEIYITDTLWPDFKKEDLIKAIVAFQSRERRFGLTSEQIRDPDKKGA